MNVEHLDFERSIADATQVISRLIEKKYRKSKIYVFLYVPMQLIMQVIYDMRCNGFVGVCTDYPLSVGSSLPLFSPLFPSRCEKVDHYRAGCFRVIMYVVFVKLYTCT